MDTPHSTNCNIALDMMNDTLDYIYKLVKPHFPEVYLPPLYLVKRENSNAFAKTLSNKSGAILVTHGLIKNGTALIEKRYQDSKR